MICAKCKWLKSCNYVTADTNECECYAVEEQTNEEWIRNASTEELVSEILSLVDGGILDSWHEEHKEIDEWDDKGVVELWLKEKHTNGEK